MTPVFCQSPAEYRAETLRISRVWWVLCPIVVPLALGLFAFLNQPLYQKYLQSEETGILEFLHAALPLAAAGIALRLFFMPRLRRDPLIGAWLALFVVGGIYLGGEEASWGQHYFGWGTPDAWSEINIQNETNIHNTVFWFDKLPRVVITVMIIAGGLIVPLVKLARANPIPARLDFIVPPLALIVLTGMFILGEILSGIKEYTELLDNVARFRAGEMQENLIVTFLFFYMVCLFRRAIRVSAGAIHPAGERAWEPAMRNSREGNA